MVRQLFQGHTTKSMNCEKASRSVRSQRSKTPPVRRAPGFTLIELLAVIAILAVLVALLMPALASAQRKVQTVVCASNLKQYGAVNAVYASDHNGWCVPHSIFPTRPTTNPNPDSDPRWFWWMMPEFQKLCGMSGWESRWKLRCPGTPVQNAAGTMRNTSSGYGDNFPDGWQWDWDWLGWQLSRVVTPSRAIFMADATADRVYWPDHGSKYSYWQAWGEDGTTWNYQRAAYRHNEGANCLFFDGHVAWRPPNQLAEDEMPAADWLATWLPYPNPGAGLPKAPGYP